MSDEPTRRSFGALRLFGKIWWVRYRVDGKERWESLRTASLKQAEKKLAVLEDRVGRNEHQTSDARRLTFKDLETLLRTEARKKGLRSIPRIERALNHLRETFGTSRALGITAERITDYELARIDAGAARATVNYELAQLRRAFRLAVTKRRLPSAPTITISDPRNARTGFFEPAEFRAVQARLALPLQRVMEFAYLTGWRVMSEVLPLTWDRVDFAAGVVRLDVNTTKNDEGRAFPFGALPDLVALLEAQREETQEFERELGKMIPFVFHRRGREIKSYTTAWAKACGEAARGGSTEPLAEVVFPALLNRIVHDFRRTAVRNLVRAGVDRKTAMRLTGHKTAAVFDRYDIGDEADLRAGVAKLAAHLTPSTPAATTGPETTKGTQGGPLSLKLVANDRDALPSLA